MTTCSTVGSIRRRPRRRRRRYDDGGDSNDNARPPRPRPVLYRGDRGYPWPSPSNKLLSGLRKYDVLIRTIICFMRSRLPDGRRRRRRARRQQATSSLNPAKTDNATAAETCSRAQLSRCQSRPSPYHCGLSRSPTDH